jgi:putative ATPase
VCNKSVPAHVINEHLDKGCSSVSTSASRPITLCESTPASKKQTKHTSALAPIFAPKVGTSSSQPLDLSLREIDASNPSQAKRSSETNLATPPPKRRKASPPRAHVPLAEMLRPKHLSQFIGQSHLMQQGSLLSTMLRTNASWSLIFWGPPG